MPATGASSRSLPGIGSDGTHAVQCWLCRQIVGRTTESVTRVLCAICKAAEDGEPMTEQAIRDYYASRQLTNSTSLLMVEEVAPVNIPGRKKFSLAGVGEGLSVAMGFLRRKPEEHTASASLAKAKRRGKLLDGLTEEDHTMQLGTMSEIDAMLKQNREEG